jgi:hypothetical protein
MDDLLVAQSALERAARDFDPSACSGQDVIDIVTVAGRISRLNDGIVGRAAKRVEDTAAYTYQGDRSAPELCDRLVGRGSGEAKRAIETATKLESLPATAAAVRAGKLSAQASGLIAAAAVDDPSVERELVKAAVHGMPKLREKCVAVRAAREDQAARSARQHRARSFTMWSNVDGMTEGHFQVTPEVGGAIKAKIDEETRRRFREARHDGTRDSQDAYAADALAVVILGDPETAAGEDETSTKAAPAARPSYYVHVMIDYEALLRCSTRPGETCEIPGTGPVNVEWVRSLLGEAFVTAIVKKGKDITTVAHLGRHIPAELRTAMIVSGRECSITRCTGREYLELDHCEVDHAKGGPTAKWNLAWMCSIHHTRKTQGWILGPPDPETGKRKLDPPGSWRAA